uniref:Beta-defensin-like domain-containing protein n=1 Tax=Sphenodon punctatus TaxID=8508 RepID=A0A8D0HPK5_SPHPU
MKILFLLSAVLFLVLMGVPGFTQAQWDQVNTREQCRRRDGLCVLKRCPTHLIQIGSCNYLQVCCTRR